AIRHLCSDGTARTRIYALSLHDALPIWSRTKTGARGTPRGWEEVENRRWSDPSGVRVGQKSEVCHLLGGPSGAKIRAMRTPKGLDRGKHRRSSDPSGVRVRQSSEVRHTLRGPSVSILEAMPHPLGSEWGKNPRDEAP